MERANIEQLLAKYLEAETTLAEEKELRTYFSSGEVAPALEEYQCLFDFYSEKQTARFTKKLELPQQNRRYKVLSIAASIAIIAGTFWWVNPREAAIPDSKPVAYHEAMKNTQDLLLMMTSAVQTGKKQLSYLKEFSKTENQFIQKN